MSFELMYEFWYDYVKQKYGEKSKLCYTDTNIVYIKTDDINKNIGTRFDTLSYELDRPLPKGKIEKLIGLTKDE